MREHNTIRDDETNAEIAYTFPAGQDAVDFVLDQEVGSEGRSEWTWLRLRNGDLMLGVFPTGDVGYFGVELLVERDFKQEFGYE